MYANYNNYKTVNKISNGISNEIAQLTEPGVASFLNDVLRQCHECRQQYYNQLCSIVLFALFILFFGMILLYKYKGKPTSEEQAAMEEEKKQYILAKIRNFQLDKARARQELITGLPHYEREYDSW